MAPTKRTLPAGDRLPGEHSRLAKGLPRPYLPPPDLPTGTVWECSSPSLKKHHCWLKSEEGWRIVNLKHHQELWHKVTFGPYALKEIPAPESQEKQRLIGEGLRALRAYVNDPSVKNDQRLHDIQRQIRNTT